MPSPFPGMDPYIEAQRWDDFHASCVPVFVELLVPQVRPRYTVDVERYVFIVDESDASLAPNVLRLPTPTEVVQKFLMVRSREDREPVSLIEVLSPWNKCAGDGQMQYLNKRANCLRTETHIVELDLLRGGTRLPMLEPLPSGDYFAFIGRWQRRPKVDVFTWTLHDRLPTIPIPLKEGDDDVCLDLEEALTRTYDRGGYDYALDYSQVPTPALNTDEREWAATVLQQRNA